MENKHKENINCFFSQICEDILTFEERIEQEGQLLTRGNICDPGFTPPQQFFHREQKMGVVVNPHGHPNGAI